jgi:hypothetical protein
MLFLPVFFFLTQTKMPESLTTLQAQALVFSDKYVQSTFPPNKNPAGEPQHFRGILRVEAAGRTRVAAVPL